MGLFTTSVDSPSLANLGVLKRPSWSPPKEAEMLSEAMALPSLRKFVVHQGTSQESSNASGLFFCIDSGDADFHSFEEKSDTPFILVSDDPLFLGAIEVV